MKLTWILAIPIFLLLLLIAQHGIQIKPSHLHPALSLLQVTKPHRDTPPFNTDQFQFIASCPNAEMLSRTATLTKNRRPDGQTEESLWSTVQLDASARSLKLRSCCHLSEGNLREEKICNVSDKAAIQSGRAGLSGRKISPGQSFSHLHGFFSV